MPKTNQDLFEALSELSHQLQVVQESLSQSASASPFPSESSSHITQPDYSENYTFSIGSLASICVGVLLGVPIVLVFIIKLAEYISHHPNVIHENSTSQPTVPESNTDIELAEGLRINRLEPLGEKIGLPAIFDSSIESNAPRDNIAIPDAAHNRVKHVTFAERAFTIPSLQGSLPEFDPTSFGEGVFFEQASQNTTHTYNV